MLSNVDIEDYKQLDLFQPSGTEANVIKDIANRQQFGINKYGTTVADNPLELIKWFQHAYEEALDMAIYLKRSIEMLKEKQ
jgi:hypothetical protein